MPFFCSNYRRTSTLATTSLQRYHPQSSQSATSARCVDILFRCENFIAIARDNHSFGLNCGFTSLTISHVSVNVQVRDMRNSLLLRSMFRNSSRHKVRISLIFHMRCMSYCLNVADVWNGQHDEAKDCSCISICRLPFFFMMIMIFVRFSVSCIYVMWF